MLVALVAADRLAAYLAARALASNVQSAQQLTARPSAAIRGFPFLTQVLSGRYRELDLATRAPVTEGGVRIASARVQLRDVRLKLSDVLHGTVASVPVRSGTGTALLSYDDLNQLATQQGGASGAAVSFASAGPGRVKVTGPFGLSITTGASVTNGQLRIRPDAGGLDALPAPLRGIAAGLVASPLDLPRLPFHLTIRSGALTERGLEVVADADGAVLATRR